MTTIVDLAIPDIGSTNVNVAEVYIKPGDSIKIDDNLIMLETDKATMEVPAVRAGIIKEVVIKVGDKINEGDIIARVAISEAEAATITPQQQQSINSVQEQNSTQEQNNVPEQNSTQESLKTKQFQEQTNFDEDGFANAFASPSIRKLARELGVDLSKLVC